MMDEQTLDLGSHPIFSCLNRADNDKLAQIASPRRFQEGEYLAYNGDVWPYLFLVVRGAISAVKESSEGRSLLVATFGSKELFWGIAFFHEDLPMPVSLQAGEPTLIYLWSREQMLPYLLANGCFSWELCRLMVSRMLRASAIVDDLAFHPLSGRVARMLLDQFPADQSVAPRHLTLDEMATRVGTTREMVCRILYRFAEQGAIQINRTEFIFTDRNLLEEHTRKG